MRKILALGVAAMVFVGLIASPVMAVSSSDTDTVTITSGTNWDAYVCYPAQISGSTTWTPQYGPVLQVTGVNVTVHARDVDTAGGETDPTELNGVYIGDLVGDHETWSDTVFTLSSTQISQIFSGTYPETLAIDIDVYPEIWCVQVDLVTIDITYDYAVPEIDIKPMSDPNSINMKSKDNPKTGVIPVAILTDADFDATTVDWTTVTFEGASPTHDLSDPAVVAEHQYDCDLDGDIDYVFHFRLKDTGLACGDTDGTLTFTYNGWTISASDSVRLLHCP